MPRRKIEQTRTTLARAIDENRDEIVQRWLSRVEGLVGRRLPQTELRNAIPDYLERLADLFRSGESTSAEGRAVWDAVAREHAVTRVRQEFDVSSVFREFVILRSVLVEVAREHGIADEALFEILTQAIEAAMAQTISNYVESRDAEARREHAQHVAFVTHELRNPLGAAALAAADLRGLVQHVEGARKALDLLARSHERMESLIDSVLTVERGKAGEIEPHTVEARLGDIVEDAVLSVYEHAIADHVKLDIGVDPRHRLRADPRLTASAIHNMLDNAIKYGGAFGPVEVWSEANASSVSVHVRDRCGGLSREELRTIFVPFRRGHHRRQKGTGLGLSITKQAIEAQGGAVHAESIEGGCHFWIELPRANNDERTLDPAPRR